MAKRNPKVHCAAHDMLSKHAPVMTLVRDSDDRRLIEERGPAEGKRGFYIINSKSSYFLYTRYADVIEDTPAR